MDSATQTTVDFTVQDAERYAKQQQIRCCLSCSRRNGSRECNVNSQRAQNFWESVMRNPMSFLSHGQCENWAR